MADSAGSNAAATLTIKIQDDGSAPQTGSPGAPKPGANGAPSAPMASGAASGWPGYTTTPGAPAEPSGTGLPSRPSVGKPTPNQTPDLGAVDPRAGAFVTAVDSMTEAMKAATKAIGVSEEDLDRAREMFRENLRGAIDYANANEGSQFTKLAEKPTFDPRMEAMKRINREDGQRQIQAHYERLKPGSQEPTAGPGQFARAAMAMAGVTIALRTMESGIRDSTALLTAESQARATLIATNDVQRAEIARQRGWSQNVRSIPILGGLVSSIIDQNTAEKENRLREQEAWRQRAGRLAPYSSKLSAEQMRGENAQISRDYAEAQAYGGGHAHLEQLRNDQERLKQQIGMAEEAKRYAKEERELKKTNNRLQAELGQKMVGLTEATKKLIKTLPYGGDPFGDLLRRMEIPRDQRPVDDRENNRKRDADLNKPIFDGG